MKRGFGYLPDPSGHLRTPFHRLAARLGLGGDLPPSHTISGLPQPLDQGNSGSCTGHSVAAALTVTLGWTPSPAEIYRNGRAIDRLGSTEPLTDSGAMPNQVYRAVEVFGVRPIRAPTSDGRYSDVELATVNDEPKLGDLEAEATTVLVGDYGIYSSGSQRVDEVRAALAANKPVTVAIAGGSQAFQNYTHGVLPVLNAPLDHYVLLFGYETTTSGVAFRGRNSWSDGWGESGDFWLSEAGLQELGDLVVADVRVLS